MKTASQLLFARGGAPSPICGDLPEFLCWVCGAPWTRGIDRNDWMGSNYTGQARVRCIESLYVCEPCVWSMAGKPPDTLRLTSHLVDERAWFRPNKGQKPEQRAWLRGAKEGAWFAEAAWAAEAADRLITGILDALEAAVVAAEGSVSQ